MLCPSAWLCFGAQELIWLLMQLPPSFHHPLLLDSLLLLILLPVMLSQLGLPRRPREASILSSRITGRGWGLSRDSPEAREPPDGRAWSQEDPKRSKVACGGQA